MLRKAAISLMVTVLAAAAWGCTGPSGAPTDADLRKEIATRLDANNIKAMLATPGGARPYAFVLHGLWPQYEHGWPEHCRSPDRGYVPRPVANRMLDIMPSDKLIFNEYRKHGTWSGLGVDGYFALARQLYDKVRIPERFVGLSDERLLLSWIFHEVVGERERKEHERERQRPGQ